MKKLLLLLGLLAFIGCKTPTGYQTLSTLENSVQAANSEYLLRVATAYQAGDFSATNNVPVVEKSFNDTQMAIKLAAVVASGGTNAVAPAAVQAKANSFITQAQTTK